MKVFNLACAQDHRFEGWFSSAIAFEEQQARSLIECPVCASHDIRKLLAAPRLNLSGHSQPPAPKGRQAPGPQGREAMAADPQQPSRSQAEPDAVSRAQAVYMMMARRFIESTEDVGDRFAEEARRIHYSEVPERAIRGSATPDEAEALREEGIEVFAMQIPAALKKPLQ